MPSNGSNITVSTLNIMGHILDAMEAISTSLPSDVIVLSETKLNPAKKSRYGKRIRNTTSNYMAFTSESPKMEGARGVALLVKKSIAHPITNHCMRNANIPPGCMVHLTFKPRYTTSHTHIIGVYIPSDDHDIRVRMYAYISNVLAECTQQQLPASLIVAGDFNATYQPRDMSQKVLTQDTLHRKFVASCMATAPGSRFALANNSDNQYMHTYQSLPPHGRPHCSQIDDIFVYGSCPENQQFTTQVTLPLTIDTDHMIVTANIPQRTINLPHRDPVSHRADNAGKWDPTKTRDKVVTHTVRTYMEATHAPTMNAITSALQRMTSSSRPQTTPGAALAELNEKLQAQLRDSLDFAKQHMYVNYVHPRKSFPKRTAQRTHNLIVTTKQYWRCLHKALFDGHSVSCNTHDAESPAERHITNLIHLLGRNVAKLRMNNPTIPASIAHQEEIEANYFKWQESQNWRQQLLTYMTTEQEKEQLALLSLENLMQSTYSVIRDTHTHYKKEQRKHKRTTYQQFIRALKHSSPKKAHNIIFQKNNSVTLEALQCTDGTITYDPQDLASICTNYFKGKWSQPSGTSSTAPLPWEMTTPQLQHMDTNETSDFQITPPNQAALPPTLLTYVSRRDVFDNSINNLAKGKAPGPDEVPNELLNLLPEDTKRALHQLFIAMWTHAYTPEKWKCSHTVLLYKKGDATLPSNYRPIGLCNTLYKLWTSFISTTLSTYAHEHNLLHNGQEGFRPHRGTQRQLHQLMGTYLNAKRNKRDIYVAYIDFSSAFNTISHQKLAYTMTTMGFPIDAVNVVHNLYQNTSTTITNRQPAFQTPNIDIRQGVVQGDSLSPLIFNICMDPLLKWLQTGGRGYNTNIPTSSGNLTISALAYADDLTIICGTAKNLQRQLHKLDHYCQWMGLDVNASKCEIHAVKWSDTNPLANSTLRMIRREITGKDDSNKQVGVGIQILTSSGLKNIPYVEPTKPVKYLGAMITPTLDFKAQFHVIRANMSRRLHHIQQSNLTPTQKVDMLQTTTLTAALYPITLCNFPLNSLAVFDKTIRKFFKHTWKLPKGTASDVLHLPTNLMGLGAPRMLPLIAQKLGVQLTEALADQGSLGALTRDQLEYETRMTGGMGATQTTWPAFGDFPLVRTLSMLKWANIRVTNTTPITIDTEVTEKVEVCLKESTTRHKIKLVKAVLSLRKNGIALSHALRLQDASLMLCISSVQKRALDAEGKQALHEIADLCSGRTKMLDATAMSAIIHTCRPLHTVPDEAPNLHTLQGWHQPSQRSTLPVIVDIHTHTRTKRRLNDDYIQTNTRVRRFQYNQGCHATLPNVKRLLREAIRAECDTPDAEICEKNWCIHPKLSARINFAKVCQNAENHKEAKVIVSDIRAHMPRHSKLHPHSPRYDTPRSTPRHTPFRSNVTEDNLTEQWRQHFKRHSPSRRQQTRTGLWHSILRYQEQNEVIRIENIACTNVKKRALNSTRFQTMDREDMAQVTATVVWSDQRINPAHLGLTRRYYEAHGYAIDNVQIQTSPHTYPLEPMLYLTRNHPALKTPCILRFQPTMGENLVNILETTDIADVVKAIPDAGKAAIMQEENVTIIKPSAPDKRAPMHIQQQMAAFTPHRTNWDQGTAGTFIHIDYQPVHPEKDLDLGLNHKHTGCVIYKTNDDNKVDIHDTTGRYVTSLPWTQYCKLWHDYCACADTCTALNQIDNKNDKYETSMINFKTALMLLLSRYQYSYLHLEASGSGPAHHSIAGALIAIFEIKSHIFASPLTRHPDAALYYSQRQEDCAFQAKYDPYSRPFWGNSLVTPPDEAEAIYKASKWAVLSCYSANPCLTVMLLPNLSQELGYRTWLAHDYAVHICDVAPEHTSNKARGVQDANDKKGWQVFVIANQSGREQWAVSRNRVDVMKTLANAVPKGYTLALHRADPNIDSLPDIAREHSRPKIPKRLANLLKNIDEAPAETTSQTPRVSETPPISSHTTRQPRLHVHTVLTPDNMSSICRHTQAGKVYFTDGSAMDIDSGEGIAHVTGAAFVEYRPQNERTDAEIYAAHSIRPAAPGPYNEHHRAELIAILATLQHHSKEEAATHTMTAAHIYTDSLSSMQSIKAAIFEPQSIVRKLHCDLLQKIADEILARARNQCHTHLHKVKSHVGIEGNERADKAAKAAARLFGKDLASNSGDCDARARDAYLDFAGHLEHVPSYWLEAGVQGKTQDAATATRVNVEYHLMRNPRKDIAKKLNESSCQLHQPTTIYAKGALAELDITSLTHRDIAWGPLVTDAQKRTIMRAMTGQIMNFKLLNRYSRGKIAPTCPICHQMDSTSHIICGGCEHPSMKSRVIKRHDNAMRILLKAVQKGQKGTQTIVADISPDDDPHDDEPRPQVPKRLPTRLLHELRMSIAAALQDRTRNYSGPATNREKNKHICQLLADKYKHPEEDDETFFTKLNLDHIHFRPDMAILEGGGWNLTEHKKRKRGQCTATCPQTASKTIHIVELGYVREGFAKRKMAEKRRQHDLLALLLKDLGWTVEYHTLTIGVTGTIYKDGIEAMTAIGVSATCINNVIRKWVVMTVNHTHGLVTQRRELDSHLIRNAFRKPP